MDNITMGLQMRNFNQCINCANDLLRNGDPVKADLVVTLIGRAFELGRENAKQRMVAAIETMGKE